MFNYQHLAKCIKVYYIREIKLFSIKPVKPVLPNKCC